MSENIKATETQYISFPTTPLDSYSWDSGLWTTTSGSGSTYTRVMDLPPEFDDKIENVMKEQVVDKTSVKELSSEAIIEQARTAFEEKVLKSGGKIYPKKRVSGDSFPDFLKRDPYKEALASKRAPDFSSDDNVVRLRIDGQEILRFEKNGDIYIRGNFAQSDAQVVDGLRNMLRAYKYIP